MPSLPAFADVADLAARIPGGIKDGDDDRAQAALDDASALIRAESGTDWASDFPDIVFTVTLRAALRAFTNPGGLQQESVQGWSGSFANSSTDVYLTSNEKRLVRSAAGRNTLMVQSTTRGPLETRGVCDPYANWSPPEPTGFVDPATGTEYIDKEPAGAPIPWVGPDGY